ncbi:MAG: hypothetical protein AOA65_2053 [Candidatus Bathyarchaeota archaeon BA1]|nr:MAG: hypothetical protein AOA65_2053 [Candidatus Bathyarchaeota archaeon BA1]
MLSQGRLSIRVKLDFIHQYDSELLRRFPDYDGLLRLVCFAKFKTKNGWSGARDAIIDTGAHTSILPLSVWEPLDAQILGDYFVRGLVPKKECVLEVKVGWLTGIIIDEQGNTTPETKFRCYLAPSDEVPIVLGFT